MKRVNIYSESSEDKSTLKRANIIIGRFQPITLGHLKIVEEMYKENKLPTVICQVSNKKFDSKHPFSDELISEEVKIIEKNYEVAGQIYVSNADIVKCGNALHEAGYEPILWGCGTDRYANYTKQAEKYKNDADLLDEFTTFEVKRSDDDISATKVREALKAGDVETFNKMMPKGTDKLFDKMKEAIEGIKENTWVSLKDFVKESLEDDKKSLLDFIKNADEEKINKAANYVSSLNQSSKDILYNWCWLKFPNKSKIDNFYSALKTSLRSSSDFGSFIKLCESQLESVAKEAKKEDKHKSATEINGYRLKSENDKSFLKLDFNENIGSFNLKELITEKYKDISDKTWNTIHNITFGPQPVVGKSEILFKTIAHPGNNNKYGGDIQMFDNGIEVKDFGTTNAKLGRPDILNTKPIFDFLGIKEKIGIGTRGADEIFAKINRKHITKENFETVFIEYFNNDKITKLIKELSEFIVNKINKTIDEGDLQKFINIFGVFYLFCYSIIENFNIFICTSKKSDLCFDYNYIVLDDKTEKLFSEILEKQPFRTSNIRKPGGWIDIAFMK